MQKELDTLSVNTIRTLAMDAVQAANSGHPGTPMALAPVAYVLWQRFLKFNPENPIWTNRDRFVLSAGHASMLLYSLLHLAQVKAVNEEYEQIGTVSVSLDDIKISATGFKMSRTSRISLDFKCENDDRTAWARRGNERRNGDWRKMAGGKLHHSGF